MTYPPPGNNPPPQGPGYGHPGQQLPYEQPPQHPGMYPYGQFVPARNNYAAGIAIAVVAVLVLATGVGVGAYFYLGDDDTSDDSTATSEPEVEADRPGPSDDFFGDDGEGGSADDWADDTPGSGNTDMSAELDAFVTDMFEVYYESYSRLNEEEAMESLIDRSCGGLKDLLIDKRDSESYKLAGLEEWSGEWSLLNVDERSDSAEINVREQVELVADGKTRQVDNNSSFSYEVVEGDWCLVHLSTRPYDGQDV
ncbi:hypothetical protein [Haloglycomyces albus]|uniref:hypothetical protein n=1 Tax=Haloglycomyces albus TaxID=526067 RepID=UPI00046D230F|nr:hypothetical protein [Haloglycomyces albus]